MLNGVRPVRDDAKADYVRLVYSHPIEQIGEALVNVVDVEGGDPHGTRGLGSAEAFDRADQRALAVAVILPGRRFGY
jgi:hypothetical protein